MNTFISGISEVKFVGFLVLIFSVAFLIGGINGKITKKYTRYKPTFRTFLFPASALWSSKKEKLGPEQARKASNSNIILGLILLIVAIGLMIFGS